MLRPAASGPILQLPTGLIQVAHFRVEWARTWGKSRPKVWPYPYSPDAPYQADAVNRSGLGTRRPDQQTYLFVLRVHWYDQKATAPRYKGQRPDVENAAKTITDAFTGTLFEDDDLGHVCAVQTECFGVIALQDEHTDVWVFAVP